MRLASRGLAAADAACLRCGEGITQPARLARPLDAHVSDRSPTAGSVDWGEYAQAVQRWEHVLGLPAPVPTEPAPRGGRRLHAEFVEWMMGLVPGFVCDLEHVPRAAQLRALGNGVVPQQASYAITLLLADLSELAGLRSEEAAA